MLNIVIPMAGRGSRFQQEGYALPKPLIPVFGRPMISRVVDNLRPSCAHRFIFLCLQEHLDTFGLAEMLDGLAPGASIVPIEHVTEGAACTVLLARHLIDNADPLMIANSDQWVEGPIDRYLAALQDHDGLIMTMWADDPKWSFVRLDAAGDIVQVVEKEVVSNEATVGIYNFARGHDFVASADAMIAQDLRVNGEFYVAPVYNHMLGDGQRIAYFNVGRECDGMHGLGIPADLKRFEADPRWASILAP